MDQNHRERLTRALTAIPSRRDILRGLAGAGLGWGVARLPDGADAKKKRKRKKKTKKAKPNAFGCLDVDNACKTADQCCSGVCEGKKGKKTCRAHDTGTCEQERPGYCAEGNPYLALCNGGEGVCFRTTAGSNVCANDFVCADCQRDADCEALGFPLGTACAPVGGDLACADLCESGMACVYETSAETSEA